VVLVNGALAAYLARGDRQLTTFVPDAEPERSKSARAVAQVLIDRARTPAPGGDSPRGMLIEDIDGVAAALHPLNTFLVEAGFIGGAMGLQATFRKS
jgi:ATP-dependent Lhr-like helicase